MQLAHRTDLGLVLLGILRRRGSFPMLVKEENAEMKLLIRQFMPHSNAYLLLVVFVVHSVAAPLPPVLAS